MSVALFPPLSIEIGDFDFRVKARNAFLTRGFLPSDAAKVRIYSEKQELFVSFFYKTAEDNANALRYSFLRSKETAIRLIVKVNKKKQTEHA